MKVLHFFGNLNIGGAETFVMNLYRNIDKDKIHFDFVVHGDNIGYFEDEILHLGGNIFKLPKYKVYNHFKYKKRVRELLKIFNPKDTIIHTHIMSVASIILKEAKKQGFKTIAHSHTSQYQNKNFIEKSIRKFLLDKVPKYSNVNIACSNDAGLFLFKKGKYIVLKNGINLSSFKFNESKGQEIREILNIGDKYIIGHVGRFDNAKNQKFVVEIFSKYLRKNPESVLMLIGDGPNKHHVKKIINELKIENNVIFGGLIPNVNEYMSAMDILIFPSLFEGFPVVLVEAQASGLPVIASNTITKDIKLTDRLYFMDLNDPIEKWIDLIKKIEIDIDRTSKFNMEKLYDFDSKKVAQDYTNIILEMSENNE